MKSSQGREDYEYRGRIAPSPTGYLHLGHARTFWTAQERARVNKGTLVLRNEDLDRERCKPEFVSAMFEDLRWLGFNWQEGPDVGGNFGPYAQSERMTFYREAFEKLRVGGFIYHCTCSRKDLQCAVTAPHAADDELIYPGTCRPQFLSERAPIFSLAPTGGEGWGEGAASAGSQIENSRSKVADQKISWRFLVPDGETISFADGQFGPQSFVAGKDFGDFIVWRHDDIPAYQLAVVVDDAAMQISEVVRGADLLLSTARQILLYRALGLQPPAFYHCLLMNDESGVRLAKRHDALSLRSLRQQGANPETLRVKWCSS